jgi:hypothetical protein
MGANLDSLEIEDCCVVDFCIAMTLRDRRTNFRWVMVTVYGPINHQLSELFSKVG